VSYVIDFKSKAKERMTEHRVCSQKNCISGFKVSKFFPKFEMQKFLTSDDSEERFMYATFMQTEGFEFNMNNFSLPTEKPGDPYNVMFLAHSESKTGVVYCRPTWQLMFEEARKFKESKPAGDNVKIYAFGIEFNDEIHAMFGELFEPALNLGGPNTFSLISK